MVQDERSAIARINEASSADAVIRIFEQTLSGIGAESHCVVFLPRPEEDVEDLCLSWKVPPKWRALYSREKFFQKCPIVRHCGRTVLPFDSKDAPYDPETEPQMKEVLDRSRDFGLYKGITVPIPFPRGIAGGVWMAGPHFDDHEAYTPFLHSLALHVFHRLEQFLGRRVQSKLRLTDREVEVLAWAAEGKTAWDTSLILHVSQRTVESHIRQACSKLGARNRTQAIAILGNTRRLLRSTV